MIRCPVDESRLSPGFTDNARVLPEFLLTGKTHLRGIKLYFIFWGSEQDSIVLALKYFRFKPLRVNWKTNFYLSNFPLAYIIYRERKKKFKVFGFYLYRSHVDIKSNAIALLKVKAIRLQYLLLFFPQWHFIWKG